MLLEKLEQAVAAYLDGYRDAAGGLPEMMELKRVHTACVVRLTGQIAAGEGFPEPARRAACAAALLHDVGRYEQLRRYRTFRDADSVDHAVFSHDIVKGNGWLDPLDPEMRAAILAAVLYHNRREVPAGLDALTARAVHAVRDADKLDIFRILEEQIETTAWQSGSQAFWNLPLTGPLNPPLVAGIEAGLPGDYRLIRSLADFVMIQVGWMISGLAFRTSRRLCRAGGHAAYRRAFLHRLTDDPAVDRLCDLAERRLAEEGEAE